MPIYDYICPNCKTTVEDKFVFYPDVSVICPNCGAEMNRQFGFVHIRGFPKIPKNHLPKSMGGDFEGKDAYWQGTESRYR